MFPDTLADTVQTLDDVVMERYYEASSIVRDGREYWDGVGKQDQVAYAGASDDFASVEGAGGVAVSDFLDGDHDWSVFRQELREFLTEVAFKPAAS